MGPSAIYFLVILNKIKYYKRYFCRACMHCSLQAIHKIPQFHKIYSLYEQLSRAYVPTHIINVPKFELNWRKNSPSPSSMCCAARRAKNHVFRIEYISNRVEMYFWFLLHTPWHHTHLPRWNLYFIISSQIAYTRLFASSMPFAKKEQE